MPYSNPTIRINKDMKYKYQYKIDVGKLSIPITPSSGVPCGEPYHVTILGIHLASWYRFSAVWTLRKHLQSWFRPINWLKSPTTRENTIKHRLEYLLDGCQKINAALLLFRSPKRVKSSPTEDLSWSRFQKLLLLKFCQTYALLWWPVLKIRLLQGNFTKNVSNLKNVLDISS